MKSVCPKDYSLIYDLPDKIAELEQEIAELRAKLQAHTGGEGA